MKTQKKWIRAEDGSDNSVVYYDEEGNKLTRYWKAFPIVDPKVKTTFSLN